MTGSRRPRVSTLLLALLVVALVVPASASAAPPRPSRRRVRQPRARCGLEPGHGALRRRAGRADLAAGSGRPVALPRHPQPRRLRRRARALLRRVLAQLCAVAVSLRQLHDNGGDVRVARFRANQSFSRARRSTRRMLLDVEHSSHSNHNGGQLAFGPNGRLYASVGDGGGSCDPGGNAQDLSSRKRQAPQHRPGRLGAGWRVDGYGLRNLWRFSFDRSTGRLYAADVGQGRWEEVNSMRASRPRRPARELPLGRREGSALSGCPRAASAGPGAHLCRGRLQPCAGLLGHAAATSTGGGAPLRAFAAGTSSATTAPAASGG